MKKGMFQRLTMLAVIVMASMTAYAQGGTATTIDAGKGVGETFDYRGLKYKILDNASGYTVEVVGFEDNLVANPDLFDTSEDLVQNTVAIPHFIGSGSGVAVNVYVSGVAANAFQTVDADLAAKATKMTIDYVDNDKTAGVPITIGANAFAGLTSLTEVKSFTPGAKVATIPTTAFAADVYKKAKLIVATADLLNYANKDGWKKFYFKTDGTTILGDQTGDGKINVLDLNKIKKMIVDHAYSTAADFNGDGKINVLDLNSLKKVIAKTY